LSVRKETVKKSFGVTMLAFALMSILTLFPNMTGSGEYRVQFESSFVTAIAKASSLQMTQSNRFNSGAAAGTKKSDTPLLTRINIALGSK
jgi:hypothetical protein